MHAKILYLPSPLNPLDLQKGPLLPVKGFRSLSLEGDAGSSACNRVYSPSPGRQRTRQITTKPSLASAGPATKEGIKLYCVLKELQELVNMDWQES